MTNLFAIEDEMAIPPKSKSGWVWVGDKLKPFKEHGNQYLIAVKLNGKCQAVPIENIMKYPKGADKYDSGKRRKS